MIFISYAKEDTERASKIFSMLNKPNRPVFYDKEALLPGMDWKFEIEEKLHRCSLILILCSAHSVQKEGFVQREIRMAIERAENMPDGRIFIIPIRFDNVEVPRKLAKYQWLEISSESEFSDLEFFIDVVWNRIGQPTQPTEVPVGEIAIDNILLREKVVILLSGKNTEAEDIYTFLQLPLWKLQQLRRIMNAKEDFYPGEFGTMLASGKGEVPLELAEKMRAEHNMVDVPTPQKNELDRIAKQNSDYILGFYEAYKSVLGDDVVLPLVNTPEIIPSGSTAIREGLKDGLKAAQRLDNDAS